MCKSVFLAVFVLIIISILFTSSTIGVCVNNRSCRAIHAELYERRGGKTFSKEVKANSTECCDAGNKDCWTGKNADNALFWIDCDTKKRNKKGFGQTVVACSFCEISVYDNGLIVVNDEKEPKRTRAVFSCKY